MVSTETLKKTKKKTWKSYDMEIQNNITKNMSFECFQLFTYQTNKTHGKTPFMKSERIKLREKNECFELVPYQNAETYAKNSLRRNSITLA